MADIENLVNQENEAIAELRKRVRNELNSEMYKDTLMFYRFLKARSFDIDKAEAMLRKHIIWRKAFRVDTVLQDFKPSEPFSLYYQGTYLGEDKEGCGLRYLALGNISLRDMAGCYKYNDFARHQLWVQERDVDYIKEMNKKTGRNATKFAYIINMEYTQLSDAISQAAQEIYKRAGQQFQDNFPERLKVIYFINAPKYFVLVFAILKRLLDPVVVSKFRTYGKNDWKPVLIKDIDASVLPAFLGGNRTDPDGNPMCNTFIYHGGRTPAEYFLTNKDRTFKDNSRVKRFTVQAGKSHEVVVEVEKCGTVIEWEFIVAKKDIGFGLYYSESNLKREEILPIFIFDTIDGTENVEYRCQKSGTYFIIFDNTHSWMSSKEISYCISLKDPIE